MKNSTPYSIGTIIKLKVPFLNNPPGSIGIVYDQYSLCNNALLGSSIIFQNGMHGRFSDSDQRYYLEHLGFSKKYSKYEFSHPSQLERDWQLGYWSEIFNPEAITEIIIN